MWGIENAFEREFVLYFQFYDHYYRTAVDSSYHTFQKIRCLYVVIRISKSFDIVQSVITTYTVYVVSELYVV